MDNKQVTVLGKGWRSPRSPRLRDSKIIKLPQLIYFQILATKGIYVTEY